MTTQCVTLWIGERLGPVERACLRSVARHHPIALYCYEEPCGVPAEVELRDASKILDYETVTAAASGSPGLSSDWFRYELQRRGLGTWLDIDLYLLAPLDSEKPYLFGRETDNYLNNAVLRVEPNSPLLPRLIEPFVKRSVPKWLPLHSYLANRARALIAGGVDLTKMPWGTTGPVGLTALANELGLTDLAEPQVRFYPVPWQDARWILDPGIQLEDVIGEGTVAVHLWNYCIREFKDEPAPPGSFLARLQLEGGV